MPSELKKLIRRVAAYPGGLEFLQGSYLESVAVTLGVHPFIVDAAREYLDTPAGRAQWTEEVRLAGGENGPAPASLVLEKLGEVERVIAAAERHPKGTGFLLDAPLDAVAAELAVHPYLVLRARGHLRRKR